MSSSCLPVIEIRFVTIWYLWLLDIVYHLQVFSLLHRCNVSAQSLRCHTLALCCHISIRWSHNHYVVTQSLCWWAITTWSHNLHVVTPALCCHPITTMSHHHYSVTSDCKHYIWLSYNSLLFKYVYIFSDLVHRIIECNKVHLT